METNKNEILSLSLPELAQSVKLREGVEGITRALWVLHSQDIPSTRAWSQELHIPVPVLAALRRELEKREVMETGSGLKLTHEGKRWLRGLFQVKDVPKSECPTCQGSGFILPPELAPVLEKFRRICDQRPSVDVTLDQSHATPETGIRKALYLLENGLLAEPLFFLGDDDLISVACYLMRRTFIASDAEVGSIVVADIDPRYLEMIQEVSNGTIQTVSYDVREDLPAELVGRFAVALTDPAYTHNAILTFAYRCFQALRAEGSLLLSMPIPDAPALLALQRGLADMGWALRSIHREFNRYLGASIHAHVSTLFIYIKSANTPRENSFSLSYTPFYTGEVRRPGGVYQCTLCDTMYSVGPEQEFQTIQQLKESGCAECGNNSFRRVGAGGADVILDAE